MIKVFLRIEKLFHNNCPRMINLTRKKGDKGVFITLVPKVFNNVFLFAVLTTLGTLNEYSLS